MREVHASVSEVFQKDTLQRYLSLIVWAKAEGSSSNVICCELVFKLSNG